MRLEATSTLLLQIKDEDLPAPVREFKFLEGRKFRFDFAWPKFLVAIEIDGGVWTRGRHLRPTGFQSDCDKMNLATCAGWSVLRCTPADVQEGKAITFLTRLLAMRALKGLP